MNIKTLRARAWRIGSATVLLGFSLLPNVQADGIYTSKAVLNKQTGDHLQVWYQGHVTQASDLYLAAQINQALWFFTERYGLSPAPAPLLRQNAYMSERALVDLDSTQIPAGRYQLYQVLTRADGNVFNVDSWVSGLSSVNFIVGEAQASSQDYDGDGFSDDDHDRDGYHDDDHDRDGYHDDDHDRDGYHDDDDDQERDDDYTAPQNAVNPPSSNPPPASPSKANYPDGARLLASQCFQCHGTEGMSITRIDSLREEADEIAEELFEMKFENKSDIMALHAKGYSDDEIRSIDAYFRALYGVNR